MINNFLSYAFLKQRVIISCAAGVGMSYICGLGMANIEAGTWTWAFFVYCPLHFFLSASLDVWKTEV